MSKKDTLENEWTLIWFKMSQKHPEQKGVMTMITGGLILNLQCHQQKDVIP